MNYKQREPSEEVYNTTETPGGGGTCSSIDDPPSQEVSEYNDQVLDNMLCSPFLMAICAVV
jgi:hypothetical protein